MCCRRVYWNARCFMIGRRWKKKTLHSATDQGSPACSHRVCSYCVELHAALWALGRRWMNEWRKLSSSNSTFYPSNTCARLSSIGDDFSDNAGSHQVKPETRDACWRLHGRRAWAVFAAMVTNWEIYLIMHCSEVNTFRTSVNCKREMFIFIADITPQNLFKSNSLRFNLKIKKRLLFSLLFLLFINKKFWKLIKPFMIAWN